MATRKVYDAVATVGTYKDRQTGEEKKRRVNVGAVFENDQGQLSMRLEMVPVGKEWSGWISFYEPRGDRQGTTRRVTAPAGGQPAPEPPQGGAGDTEEDDIPF